MTASSDNTLSANHGDHGSPVTPRRRLGTLLHVLGVCGGAIGGAFVGIAAHGIADNITHTAFLLLLYLSIGAVVGDLACCVGCLAGLGVLAAELVVVISQSEKCFLYFLLFPLVGGSIGLPWTLVAWARRGTRREKTEANAVVWQDRRQLFRISLAFALGIGIIAGVMIPSMHFAEAYLFGAAVGLIIFCGIAFSGLADQKTGNLLTIFGIVGGIIGWTSFVGWAASHGTFVGDSCDYLWRVPTVRFILFHGSVVLLFAVGAMIGAVAPRAGCLAGLGAVVASCLSITKHSTNVLLSFPLLGEVVFLGRWGADRMPSGLLLLPLLGEVIGLFWAAWIVRQAHQMRPSPGTTRRDRFLLALISLIVGPLLGIVVGIVLGRPEPDTDIEWCCNFTIVEFGSLLGFCVGSTICIGLMLSAFIFGSQK